VGIFTTVSGRVAQSVNFSRPLLTYPSVTVIDAILARFILNMLTQVMVTYLVFSGILMIYDTMVIIKLPAIAGAVALAGALALGVGTLNCFLFTRFPLWAQIWGILMRPLYIISCIFMIFDDLPDWARDVLWYNPIVHIVGMMRHGYYSTYHATYVSGGYVLTISGICMSMGGMLLRKHQRTLLNR
jgi:capsular polysaccharide transport system permease protein